MLLQNYQNLIEMTSNMIDIVGFGVGFKCPRKIHLNTQWERGVKKCQFLIIFSTKNMITYNFVCFFAYKGIRSDPI